MVAALGARLADAERDGLLAVAVSPALLTAPALATALGGRMDRAGSLLVGTIAAAFVLVLTRATAVGPAFQSGILGFGIGAGINSMLPMLGSVVRTVVQRLGDAAFVVLLAVAAAGGPAVGPTAALAALALVGATVGAAALVARSAGIDVRSAIAGAGTRDPAVAVALAIGLGGPRASGVPLYSALVLLVLTAVLAALNHRKAR